MCGPGAKEKFETDDKDFYDPDKHNSPRPVTEAFKEVMIGDANILLLSGAAGSGKSTAYDKLQTWVLDEYTREKKEKEVRYCECYQISSSIITYMYTGVGNEVKP